MEPGGGEIHPEPALLNSRGAGRRRGGVGRAGGLVRGGHSSTVGFGEMSLNVLGPGLQDPQAGQVGLS